jgi:crotonobetainyl-CoA:carnitine CoA-transferase CaiB-like acyl-CoA transferase
VTFDGRATPEVSRCSPGLGDHTDELLRGAGYTDAAIADLKQRRIAQ